MSTPVYGVEGLAFVRTQSAHDTISAFTGSHAFGYLDLKIEPSRELLEINEHTGTATLQGEYRGKVGGTWSVEVFHKITAAATALPHGAFLTLAGMSFSGGVYSFDPSQPTSGQIAQKVGSSLYKLASGAWCEKVEIEIDGAKGAMFRASGGFSTFGYLGGSPVLAAGSVSTGATSATLSTASKWKILPGARVAFGSDTGTAGAGYLITAVADNGVGLTFSPGLVGAGLSGGDAVTPVVPTGTFAGTVIGGIADGWSVDSTALGLINGKITIDTGIHGLNKECTTDRPNRLARGKRRVHFEGEAYFLDENAHLVGGAYQTAEDRAFIMRAGANTAGVRILHNLPKTKVHMTSPEVPESDEATIKFQSIAHQNSAAEDEFTIDTN